MGLRSENILIMGAYGRLGTELSSFLESSHNVLKLGRNKTAQVYVENVTIQEIEKVLRVNDITIIINLIANTDVDDCENDPEKAFLVNAIIPQYISSAVNKVNSDIFVLHVSTDQVYSDKTSHKEHQYKPCNIYGASKFSGEMSIANSNNVCILRTNYFGLSKVENRSSYLDWLTASINERKEISLFQNVFFTPLGCNNLCSIILIIIKRKLVGIYNLGSNRVISKAEFAEIVARKLGVDNPKFIYSEYSSTSNIKRPLDMSMDSNKLLNELLIDPIVVEDDIAYELSKMAIN